MTDLGTVAGLRFSRANAINVSGIIAGTASQFEGFSGRAFVWKDGQLADLNQRIPADSGWVLTSAEGINDRGQIVGFGTFQGQTRAFLLTPDRRHDDDDDDDDVDEDDTDDEDDDHDD
jgi:probable HAF family extracellular repeat protein